MYKPEYRTEFQNNPEAFEVFKFILFPSMTNPEFCNPDFLVMDEQEARDGGVFDDDSISWPTEQDVDDAYTLALSILPTQNQTKRSIREKYDRILSALKSPYMVNEQNTFETQRLAVIRYDADPLDEDAFVLKMANRRGLTYTEVIEKIRVRITNYDKYYSAVLGAQQAEIDALNT